MRLKWERVGRAGKNGRKRVGVRVGKVGITKKSGRRWEESERVRGVGEGKRQRESASGIVGEVEISGV